MTLEAPTVAGGGEGFPAVPQGHGAVAIAHLPFERVNAPQSFLSGFGGTARDIWERRELLRSLVGKELKVKYKGSALGFAWSLLRPIFLVFIYWLAVGKFLGNNIPGFVVFLFSGLVVWTFYADVVNSATQSIVANAGLIKKTYFPREILPLAAVGAALVQFGLMLVVLIGTVFVTGRTIDSPSKLLLLPVSLVGLVLFATAVALLVSAANVYLRDTQHLLEVVLQFWFYMTPIIYPIGRAIGQIHRVGPALEQIYLANPLAIVAFGFQDAIYQHGSITVDGKPTPVLYGGHIWAREGVLIVVSAALLWFAQRVFARAQGNFAQEL